MPFDVVMPVDDNGITGSHFEHSSQLIHSYPVYLILYTDTSLFLLHYLDSHLSHCTGEAFFFLPTERFEIVNMELPSTTGVMRTRD